MVPATGTPTARAARSLPPTAKIQLPARVRSRIQLPRATRASHHTTVALTGTPPTVRVDANRARALEKPSMSAIVLVETVPPISLVKPRFMPVSIRKVPSVTMKLGSLVRASTRPLKAPTASVTSRDTPTPTQTLAVIW
ncbi:hypothetical protein SGRIM128S_00260 [Streptomyces griseomycini]